MPCPTASKIATCRMSPLNGVVERVTAELVHGSRIALTATSAVVKVNGGSGSK